jgi:hypothetical protein
MVVFLRDALVAHAGQLGLAENDVLRRTSRGTLFRLVPEAGGRARDALDRAFTRR